MKKILILGFALLVWNASAQSILIETPTFDGTVIVTGAPVPQPDPVAATPVVYDQPVVYNGPVQYTTPVVYNGPVIYNNVTPTRSASCDDFGGMSITVYPRRNCYRNTACNVTVIGRGSALIR